MLDWISQHQKVLSVLISFGTLLIWLVYVMLDIGHMQSGFTLPQSSY